jgi:hypothetical protein
MECLLFWPMVVAVIISCQFHVVLISFILIRKNQETILLLYLYLITLCKKHVHCDIIFIIIFTEIMMFG